MATEFKLPELGENVESGTISKVLVAEGDTVSSGQAVFEVESEKAVAEIPIDISGTIAEIRVKEGDEVRPGQVVMVVEESGAGKSEKAPPEKPEATGEKEAAAPAERPKPRKEETGAAAAEEAPAKQQAPTTGPASAQHRKSAKAVGRPVLASPSVRRLARELEVDLHEVPVADPTGRITAQDVRDFAAGRIAVSPEKPAGQQPDAAPKPRASASAELEQEETRWGAVAYEPMSTVRKKTTEHMTRAWTTIPHVTHFEKADVTDIGALRDAYAGKIERDGGKLTVLAFVLKAVAEALRRFPKFNSSLDLENERLVLKQYYHIGVAVDTPSGLLVPVLRDVDRKSIRELSLELPEIAARARERKVSIDEMRGGTFTVTNLGGLGGHAFTPIINPPEVAILGMSRSRVEPVYRDGEFVPRTLLPLSLSYDHRIIDGADAARFARWVVQAVEQPWMMFMGL